ncbi:hypothetical protein DFH07DRAFT_949257 [Mycena maculata]|uniref:Uncharacterized protein n=1 Tax=Mycena maculata TaxID=230809 RepID=A0AAD7KBK6_9AGAR|nr:hypothetical protein DFH07DRAFT_949257 [Mycena maculata]
MKNLASIQEECNKPPSEPFSLSNPKIQNTRIVHKVTGQVKLRKATQDLLLNSDIAKKIAQAKVLGPEALKSESAHRGSSRRERRVSAFHYTFSLSLNGHQLPESSFLVNVELWRWVTFVDLSISPRGRAPRVFPPTIERLTFIRRLPPTFRVPERWGFGAYSSLRGCSPAARISFRRTIRGMGRLTDGTYADAEFEIEKAAFCVSPLPSQDQQHRTVPRSLKPPTKSHTFF